MPFVTCTRRDPTFLSADFRNGTQLFASLSVSCMTWVIRFFLCRMMFMEQDRVKNVINGSGTVEDKAINLPKWDLASF